MICSKNHWEDNQPTGLKYSQGRRKYQLPSEGSIHRSVVIQATADKMVSETSAESTQKEQPAQEVTVSFGAERNSGQRELVPARPSPLRLMDENAAGAGLE